MDNCGRPGSSWAAEDAPCPTRYTENLTLAISDGAVIPDSAGITDEASLQEALSETPQEMPETGGVEMGTLEELPDH